MLYPLKPCVTQPLIDIDNVTIRNVQQYGTILPPGVIRCNETNPCTGFVFQNVQAHGWWKIFGLNYITENVRGVVANSKPVPAFIGSDGLSYVNETEDGESYNLTAFIENKVYPWIKQNMSSEDEEDNHKRTIWLKAAITSFSQVYSFIAY